MHFRFDFNCLCEIQMMLTSGFWPFSFIQCILHQNSLFYHNDLAYLFKAYFNHWLWQCHVTLLIVFSYGLSTCFTCIWMNELKWHLHLNSHSNELGSESSHSKKANFDQLHHIPSINSLRFQSDISHNIILKIHHNECTLQFRQCRL